MLTTIEPKRYFHVTGTSAREVERDITKAVDLARQGSTAHGWLGVLVTRHDVDLYTVALSPLVPYGQTVERSSPEVG